MDIGVVGGGINGLCCAWRLASQGHQVSIYERGRLLNATSSASSKLLHGGLRYLENGEFRLVREALRERDAWIRRVPKIAKPIRLVMPVYKESCRPGWMISTGLFLYDHLAGKSFLPKAKHMSSKDILQRDPAIKSSGLLGGYEFSDGQMDDKALGQWVAEQISSLGVTIAEHSEVTSVATDGSIKFAGHQCVVHDRVLNVTGPWAEQLLRRSGVKSPYKLDLVRGSHLIFAEACKQAYLLEVPGERRIFFVLPWKGKTLIGTTEVRQTFEDPVICNEEEKRYLLNAYRHYFSSNAPEVIDSFAGLRPLLHSADDPSKATREYALYRNGKLLTVLGGKWTTAMALAEKVLQEL